MLSIHKLIYPSVINKEVSPFQRRVLLYKFIAMYVADN